MLDLYLNNKSLYGLFYRITFLLIFDVLKIEIYQLPDYLFNKYFSIDITVMKFRIKIGAKFRIKVGMKFRIKVGMKFRIKVGMKFRIKIQI